MANLCDTVVRNHGSKIEEIVQIQREENREAIFFVFQDDSTSETFKGEPKRIELTDEEQARVLNQGRLKMSIHSHPTGFDPSTIDIMTGILTRQDRVCVAVPIREDNIDDNFVLTCLDVQQLNFSEKRRLFRSMRRSSLAVSRPGHEVRKQFNLQRFPVRGCRTHDIDIEGIEFPQFDRPSFINFTVGEVSDVKSRSDN